MKKHYFLGIIMIPALMLVSAMAYGQFEAIAIYKFDETSGSTAADATASGFDAIVTDGTTECDTCWGEGTIDGAVHLWGTQHVALPADVMGMTSVIGSIALWVKADNPTSIYTLWSGGDNETGGGFGPENEMHVHLEQAATDIWVGGELSFFAIANPNTFLFSDPEKGNVAGNPPVNPIIVADNEWHHVAATWGKGLVKLYIDGEPIWDTTVYGPTGYDLSVMKVGSMLGNGRATIGFIDDFRIYDDVIDDDKVSDLYNKITYVDHLLADEIDMSIYPNPATSEATLSFSIEAGRDVSVNLYGVTGGLVGNVYEGISVAGKNVVHLNMDNFSPGIYFVELQLNNEVTYTKLVVQ